MSDRYKTASNEPDPSQVSGLVAESFLHRRRRYLTYAIAVVVLIAVAIGATLALMQSGSSTPTPLQAQQLIACIAGDHILGKTASRAESDIRACYAKNTPEVTPKFRVFMSTRPYLPIYGPPNTVASYSGDPWSWSAPINLVLQKGPNSAQ